jgi:type I restriction enzyme S subunit
MTNQAQLGDVAQFINGAAFKPEDWGNEGLRIIRIQNLTDNTKPYNFTNRKVDEKLVVKKGDLLVSWSATLGVFEWQREENGLLNQHIFRVIPNIKVIDKQYLKHVLVSALGDMNKHLHGATMKHVNRGEFLATKIPLPPLAEQKRIAAILDQAEDLRRKREQSIEKLDQLAQSKFVEMFGDPINNNKGWPQERLDGLVRGKYGVKAGPFGSALKKEDYVVHGYKIYGQEQVIAGSMTIGNYYISNEKYKQLSSCAIAEGDVLVSLVGSFGKVLVVPQVFEAGIINPRLLKISPNEEKLLPNFLSAILTNDQVQAKLKSNAHGGTMGILNAGLLKELVLIVPPISLQKRFIEVCKKIEDKAGKLQDSMITSNYLFSSLQHQAFTTGFRA